MRSFTLACGIFIAFISSVRAAEGSPELGTIGDIVSSLRALPNCQFTYHRKEGRQEDPEPASLQDQLRGVISQPKWVVAEQTIHFRRFDDCFDIRVFEDGKLLRRICHDGTAFYYLERYRDKAKLRVGRMDEVMDRVTSTTLMNSPLFVQFRPLAVLDKTRFYFPFLGDIKHWSELAALYSVKLEADRAVSFNRMWNGGNVTLLFQQPGQGFPTIRFTRSDGSFSECKITDAIKLPWAPKGAAAHSFLLPVRYNDGKLSAPDMPARDGSCTEVDIDSVKELTSINRSDFSIPKAEADTIVDTTLGIKAAR